ncbi:MAG TPA: NUDIX hydrolase [Pyrinomonadaceae bacterium]|jgi:8-oxo-dGTP pyrophosphatase MutT (NUDIX family)
MKKKNGDWTIKDTEKKFGNDFFEVFEDDVVEPDGKDGKYATIRFKPGVSVLPVDDEGNVYLTRQFRYALGRDNVEAIAGAIEDEGRLQAGKREAREELGIEAEDWKYLGKIESDTSITNSLCHLYLARKLTFKKPKQESTEDIKIVKMKLENAVQKVLDGEITHGQACVLILKAEKLLSTEAEN